MTERVTWKLGLLFTLLGIFGCSDSSDSPPAQEEPFIAFEILEVQSLSPTSIVTWGSDEPTIEEFEALELEPGWLKNQPREFEVGECPPITAGSSNHLIRLRMVIFVPRNFTVLTGSIPPRLYRRTYPLMMKDYCADFW